MGYWPELVNCRDFNHKIQWLKLFDQDESMVKCSDKLLVRDYVSERVGSKYLTALYQVGSQYQDIDFDRLPKSFVLKTNHDSGSVVLVRDKSILDHCATARLLNASLNRVYGSEKGEWAYALIAPKLFVEEFIDPGENMPPPDFKFHCVDGKVRYLHYIYDRGGDTRELFTDRQCRLHAFNVYFPYGDQRVFSKPIEWDEMVEIAEKLSGPFKYVRVDMFLSSGRIYVGEMTFWPMAGCYHEEGQGVLGRALDFDRHNAKPPVYLALS